MKRCPNCSATFPADFSLCPHDGVTLHQIHGLAPGDIVKGKYRILGRIGAGGMAEVFKAEHIHFGELRALKIINPDLSSGEEFVRRFMREAVLTRRLHHPNAVRVDDIDVGDDGRPFIVMELLEGINLAELIRMAAPLSTGRACAIAEQVGSALQAAHSLGIMHRDIKPSNIILSGSAEGPHVKVVDFGIAKLSCIAPASSGGNPTFLTETGVIVGTPAYMSPEQAIGQGNDLFGSSDLYSLGVVFYQMLTGKLPSKIEFGGPFNLASIADDLIPISTCLPYLDPPIANLVMQCLSKDPALRPRDAGHFVNVLQRWRELQIKNDVAMAADPRDSKATRERKAVPPKRWLNPRLILVPAILIFVLVTAGEFLSQQKQAVTHAPLPVAVTPVAAAIITADHNSKVDALHANSPSKLPRHSSLAPPGLSDVLPDKTAIVGVTPSVTESAWSGSDLISHVTPSYPMAARQHGIEGDVRFTVTISEDGEVKDPRFVSGPAILADAARDAIRQWRYRPSSVNGRPVEVVTDIVISFRLN